MDKVSDVSKCHSKELIIGIVSHRFKGGPSYEAKTTTPVGATQILAQLHEFAAQA